LYKASENCLASFIFDAKGCQPVSYYAFIIGWLLPSPPPGYPWPITFSFTLSNFFKSLAVVLGFFPLENRPYHLLSICYKFNKNVF